MPRSIAGSCGNNRGKRARGLEYKQKHKPQFRLYRAAKSQGRRKKKGEDCLNGGLLSPSSPVFCNAKYRGGVHRTEGLNRNCWIFDKQRNMEEKPKKLSFLRRKFVKKKFTAKLNSCPLWLASEIKKPLNTEAFFIYNRFSIWISIPRNNQDGENRAFR